MEQIIYIGDNPIKIKKNLRTSKYDVNLHYMNIEY